MSKHLGALRIAIESFIRSAPTLLRRATGASIVLVVSMLHFTYPDPAFSWFAREHASTQTVTIRLEPLGPEPFPGQTVTLGVVVDVPVALGAYSLSFDCDPTLFEIAGPIFGGDSPEFSGPPFQNVQGCHATFSAFQALSLNTPTGAVSVAKVTLRALPDAVGGATSVLDLTAVAVTATSGASLSAGAEDGVLGVATNCGNAVVDDGETCDDGDRAWVTGQACSGTCGWIGCADPNDSGATTATDALIVLNASVGATFCAPCICDVDASGGEPTASDALRTLRRAVGAPTTIVCPACF
jgi:hypothetical protein